MTRWPLIAALLMATHGGSYVWGRTEGAALSDARHAAASEALQDELFDAADRMSRQAAEIEAYRAAQAAMIEDLENAAMADPGACRLPDDARVRLRSRWGTD
jgi:hypothetical protein